MTRPIVPHLQIVVAACVAAVVGYAAFSVWTVWRDTDAALIGDIIGTWKSFAVLAFGFWLGSSSGGKQREGEPASVKIQQPKDEPIPVEETKP